MAASPEPTLLKDKENGSPSDDRIRKTYIKLFKELQFRATKNAFMNYYQAEQLDNKSQKVSILAKVIGGASTTGILGAIATKGKVLANRFGIAGVAGLPLFGMVELFQGCSNDFFPSLQERAKRHIQAAATWKRIANRSKVARLRINQDPTFTVEKCVEFHEELLRQKEQVSMSVVIPREIHEYFDQDVEKLFTSMKRRKDAFEQYEKFQFEVEDKSSEDTYYM